jgi:uncharacterized protein (TIRG00374 family)
VVFVLLVAGVYGLLPRLGDLATEAEVLRHASLALVAAALAAQGASLLLYIVFYQRVLDAMGARLPFRTVFEVTMACFLVSHVAVGGSAAGVVVNVDAMRKKGVDPEAAGEAVAFASLLSSLALLVLLAIGTGLSVRNEALPTGYLAVAACAVLLVLGELGLALLASRRPDIADRLGRWGAGRLVRVWRHVRPERVALAVRRLSERAASILSQRRFLGAWTPALGELLLDAGCLYLFFLAAGYRPQPGGILVAYATANILSVVPLTPAGLGVIEATLVTVTVAFGAPAHAAIPAVLAYRIVNFWLPLPIGLAAYLRLRLRPDSRRRHRAPA